MRKYVDDRGRVDYVGLGKSEVMKEVMKELVKEDPEELKNLSRDEKLHYCYILLLHHILYIYRKLNYKNIKNDKKYIVSFGIVMNIKTEWE